MRYIGDKPYKTACTILVRAVREGIKWIGKGKYKRAEMVLEFTLEAVSDIVEEENVKKDGC